MKTISQKKKIYLVADWVKFGIREVYAEIFQFDEGPAPFPIGIPLAKFEWDKIGHIAILPRHREMTAHYRPYIYVTSISAAKRFIKEECKRISDDLTDEAKALQQEAADHVIRMNKIFSDLNVGITNRTQLKGEKHP